jgi:2,4-dienoyl-CoA reductase-like NADH-dependent reductase (Old Yellow Enzyme family)
MNTEDLDKQTKRDWLQRCFEENQLNGLTLKNRFIKASTFENRTPNGVPEEALARFHIGFAEGELAMTTIGFCAVENNGRLFESMMYMGEHIRKPLGAVLNALHEKGIRVSGQMGHGGGFSQNKQLDARRPKGPCFGLNALGVPRGMFFCDAMTTGDIDSLIHAYKDAALFMKSVGFDALEIHFGHGYGLCQFLSPKTNRRKDAYGGSPVNRMRLPLAVLEAVREAVGAKFPLIGKISMREGVRGGLQLSDAVEFCRALAACGIDAIIPSTGTSTMRPMPMFHGHSILRGLFRYERSILLKAMYLAAAPVMFPTIPYEELYLLDDSRKIREAVDCSVIYVGGAGSNESFARLMEEGFDYIQLGRPLLCDPNLVRHAAGQQDFRSQCDRCNECVGTIQHPRGVHCPHV